MNARPRVLLAEDEPHIVESLSFLLGRAGCEVRAELDGQAALDAALDAPPDVILVDVMLPGIDGFELLRRLRADPRGEGVRVIVVRIPRGQPSRIQTIPTGASRIVF